VLGLVPYRKKLLYSSTVSISSYVQASVSDRLELLAMMPHSLTKSACFLASGHSKAVPKALDDRLSVCNPAGFHALSREIPNLQ
jgi:hypothetical protein